MKQLESNSRLLTDIIKTAEADAEALLKKASQQAEESRHSAEEKKARLLNEADDTALRQKNELIKNSKSSLSMEKSRQQLVNSQILFRSVMNILQNKLAELTETDKWKEYLLLFTIEAALGFDKEFLSVNAGEKDKKLIDPVFLKEAEKRLMEKFSVLRKLELSSEDPLTEAGIELKDREGRQAFQNTLTARMKRYNNQIRELIHKNLQEELS